MTMQKYYFDFTRVIVAYNEKDARKRLRAWIKYISNTGKVSEFFELAKVEEIKPLKLD